MSVQRDLRNRKISFDNGVSWIDEDAFILQKDKTAKEIISNLSALTHECWGFTSIHRFPAFPAFFYCETKECRKQWDTLKYFEYIMGRAVTSSNYIAHYVAWCTKNSFAPVDWETLKEIFLGCESNEDYRLVLDVLYIIQGAGQRLSFTMNSDKLAVLYGKLNLRLELFKRIPSATNMLLAYNLIEEITLDHFASAKANITDEVNKNIEKFDKLKSLALGTKFIPERQLAFTKSVEVFNKLVR